MTANQNVVVVTGAGGMGTAAVRRIGAGAHVVLADINPESLEFETESLAALGFDVTPRIVDVSQKESVDALAADAAALGRVTAVVHTAGVSPVQASGDAVMRVDLLGTALMLDALGAVISPGGAGVFIASMAGTMATLDRDLEVRLATTPAAELLDLPEVVGAATEPGGAYAIAKRANQVRVKAASVTWGRRGARVNSISPGVISTPMGAAELDGPHGEFMRAMVAGSGTGRIGTPDDIAAAVDFLVGPHAAFITGTDLLVDGGVIASLFAPQP